MTILFNALYWDSYNDEDDDDKYEIRLFGKTIDKKTVYVNVNNFTPYFYVSIPSFFDNNKITMFIREIKKKVYPKKYNTALIAYKVEKKNRFWGFTNGKLFTYLKLVFNSYYAFKSYERLLNKPILIRSISYKPYKYKLFESNIEPLLRCMHIKNINASGWIQIDKYKSLKNVSNCDINVSTEWTNLQFNDNNSIAPFKIASYDLECRSEDGSFPQATRENDQIIQIGTTFNIYGNNKCYYKHLITLGSCDKIEGITVESYKTEKEVLLAWQRLIRKHNPDVITGYNIFGFDEKYLYYRCKLLGIKHNFKYIGRLNNIESEFKTKKLSSSALGDNLMYYYNHIGMISIDLMKVVQRDYSLASYKLDNVAAEFFKEEIDKITFIKNKNKIKLYTKNTQDLQKDSYISILIDDSLTKTKYKNKKFKIIKIKQDCLKIIGTEEEFDELIDYMDEIDMVNKKKNKLLWCLAKDDVSPKDIFRLQLGSSSDRAIIGKYCIKDCVLVNKLMEKLRILTNNIGMSNVCSVPLSYIFLRGQGIKIFSLVAKKCRSKNYVIPVIKKPYDDNPDKKKVADYYGAYVYEPKPGIYFAPIAVLDYASLYPRSMIQKNMSHEKLLFDNTYNNIEGYTYHDAYYENTKCDIEHCKTIHCVNKLCNIDHNKKIVCNVADCKEIHCYTHCQFAQKITHNENKIDREYGIIPEILNDLLDARSATKKIMKKTDDPFKKNIYDGLQLAYKITANSLYGQTGASTSAICLKHIAASTTATGKEMLLFADTEVRKKFNNAEIVYGDTDSIFIKFKILDENGKEDTSKNALIKSIEYGKQASKYVNKLLPFPHDLEYEKTFWPLILVSKKRYTGNKYELDSNKYSQTSMGIVLKRRDNADIVKTIVGGIVYILLNVKSMKKAVEFTKTAIEKLMNNEFSMDKFIITKTLRAEYKLPEQVPHKVLADRMAKRDPGNKPQTNDRIPFAYVQIKEGRRKNILQGERVEHPLYIKQNNLKLDYLFYLTNQIMKPAIQFLELGMDNPKKIFEQYIYKEENKRKGIVEIDKFIVKNPFEKYYNEENEIFSLLNKNNKKYIEPTNKKIKKKKNINLKKKSLNITL
jgi:DNA polymerase elongation subunit (family B)